MKRTHACPKCGCTQIVHVPASQWLFARGGNAYLGLHLGEKVLISKYICTGCGYVETGPSARKTLPPCAKAVTPHKTEKRPRLAGFGRRGLFCPEGGRVFNTALEKCLQWRPAG